MPDVHEKVRCPWRLDSSGSSGVTEPAGTAGARVGGTVVGKGVCVGTVVDVGFRVGIGVGVDLRVGLGVLVAVGLGSGVDVGLLVCVEVAV